MAYKRGGRSRIVVNGIEHGVRPFRPYFRDEAPLSELEAPLWPHGPVCVSVAAWTVPRRSRALVWAFAGVAHASVSLCSLSVWFREQSLANAHLKRAVLDRVVHEAPHSRGNDQWHAAAVWWRRYDRRDKRDVYRSEKDKPKWRGYAHQDAVMTLVGRGGSVCSFHVKGTSAANLLPIVKANALLGVHVMTDKAGQHSSLNKFYAGHDFTRQGVGVMCGKVHSNCGRAFLQRVQTRHAGASTNTARDSTFIAIWRSLVYRVELGVDGVTRTQSALRGMVGKTDIQAVSLHIGKTLK